MGINEKQGMIFASFAYLLWGILPIYWKILKTVPSDQILAHRVVWSFVFMLLLLFFTKKIKYFFSELKRLLATPKQLIVLSVAAFLVTGNWFIYIWAVNANHLVETSLGYYINPLVTVLLGVLVLHEKLTKIQILSVVFAVIGVLILAVNFGSIPYIALSLAITFAIYSLIKKLVDIDATIALAVETLIVTPIALGYLLFFEGKTLFGHGGTETIMLFCAGVVTAVPLLYFAKGAKLIPLSTLGFFQYLSPTLMLLLGVLAYHEKFSHIDLLAFSFIWLALIIFSLSKTKWMTTKTEKIESTI